MRAAVLASVLILAGCGADAASEADAPPVDAALVALLADLHLADARATLAPDSTQPHLRDSLRAVAERTPWRVRFPIRPATTVWTLPTASVAEAYAQRRRWARGGLSGEPWVPPAYAGLFVVHALPLLGLALYFGWTENEARMRELAVKMYAKHCFKAEDSVATAATIGVGLGASDRTMQLGSSIFDSVAAGGLLCSGCLGAAMRLLTGLVRWESMTEAALRTEPRLEAGSMTVSVRSSPVHGPGQIGRAHVWTPVRQGWRMPASAGKRK